jgi:hypothetical protein
MRTLLALVALLIVCGVGQADERRVAEQLSHPGAGVTPAGGSEEDKVDASTG